MRIIHLLLAVSLVLPSLTVFANDISSKEELGLILFTDESLSLNRNQSCSSCHSLDRIRVPDPSSPSGVSLQPSPSFAHPDNIRDLTAVAEGSVDGEFGSLNAPTAGYAAFSPSFHWDGNQNLWIGGQFWDGRAATLVEQAKGPFLNEKEMAMPSVWSVVTRLKQSPEYYSYFRELFDINLELIPSFERAPEGFPAPPGVFAAFDAMAESIAAFEKSAFFNRFTSKYDYVAAGITEFTPQEAQGFALFSGPKAQCSVCHSSSMTTAPDSQAFPAMFTNFAYDNLGVPINDLIRGNPGISQGLGGRPEIQVRDPDGSELGKHKVMSLRNVALTPPYMHNGSLKTLRQVVHFYNTRDTMPRECEGMNDPGFGVDCWPAAEIPHTMNTVQVGDLGLTAVEEEAIVAFLETLTDNYPSWGNSNGRHDPSVPVDSPSPFDQVASPILP